MHDPAERCARQDWTLIDDDISVPASFFLPPDGNGVAQAQIEPFLDTLIATLSKALARMRSSTLARRGLELASVRSAFAGGAAAPRGTTLTIDRLNNLVTKDVGSERWSISYTFEPFLTNVGGVESRFLNVTGNVYQPDGSPPSFVYCTQNKDSTGTLSDPSSEFIFTCLGSNACKTTATECAQNEWKQISDDIHLQASFFLPPRGLPASPQSDSDVVVIGRTSDAPSIGVDASGEAQSVSVLVAPRRRLSRRRRLLHRPHRRLRFDRRNDR